MDTKPIKIITINANKNKSEDKIKNQLKKIIWRVIKKELKNINDVEEVIIQRIIEQNNIKIVISLW